MTTTLDYALRYAEQGWAVFPLRGKQPATVHGFKDATTDTGKLRHWFGPSGSPGTDPLFTNIGVAIPEGFWVLDVDPRNGGDESFLLIHERLPKKTLMAQTGGGGSHWWYKGDAPIVRLPGIDIKKGGKGYVVMPPSIHPETGRPYRWTYEEPIAPFSGPIHLQGSSDTGELLADVLGGSEYAREAAEGNDPILSGGIDGQHNTLLAVAGHALALYPEAVARLVFDNALERCDPPHPEHEAERIWEYVLDKQIKGAGLVGEEPIEIGEDVRQKEIEREADKLAIKEEAKKLLRERKALAEWSAVRDDVPFLTLEERLEDFDPDQEVNFVVQDLLPEFGNVVFSAQDKAGKTTFSLGLVKVLADGGEYLSRFPAEGIDRNICYMNVELSPQTANKWFSDLGLQNKHRVQTLYLRGREQWFAIESPEVRKQVAASLKAKDIGVLIIDPIGPLWDAAGINESANEEVGPYMVMLGQLAVSAGIDNVVVIQHAGHNGARARGASKILGWPDAVWSIRKDTEGAEDKRFFKAYGRDVDVPEAQFTYDHTTRAVTLLTPEEMAAKKETSALEEIRAAVVSEPGINAGDLRGKLSCRNADKSKWIDSALSEGMIHFHKGDRGAHLFHPNSSCQTCTSP